MKYVRKQVKDFKNTNEQKVLKGGTSNDAIFISKGEKWKVYSLNQLGELRDEKVFDSKEDACKIFVSEIKSQVYRRPAK